MHHVRADRSVHAFRVSLVFKSCVQTVLGLYEAAKDLGYKYVAHFNLSTATFLLFRTSVVDTQWTVKLHDFSFFQV